MAKIYINKQGFQDLRSRINSVSYGLDSFNRDILQEISRLDFDVSQKDFIRDQINMVRRKSSLISEKIGLLKRSLDNAINEFEHVDRRVAGNYEQLTFRLDFVLKQITDLVTKAYETVKNFAQQAINRFKQVEDLFLNRNSDVKKTSLDSAKAAIAGTTAGAAAAVSPKNTDKADNGIKGIPGFNGILSKDTKGTNEYVRKFQRKLNELGYRDKFGNPLVEDGVFGGNTEFAVNEFKNKNKLDNYGEYEGKVGETTWNALFSGGAVAASTASKVVSKPGSQSSKVSSQGTGKAGDWLPNEMRLDGSSDQEKYLKSRLERLGIKWNQEKVHALWQATAEINKKYGVQMDPRFLLAIIIHEGTGSFNTSSSNRAADGQNGVESNYAIDLMKANSLVFGKILGYIKYGSEFKQVVVNNSSKGGISGSGDIFQYCNWSTPIVRLNSGKVETGVYAGDGSWCDGVRAIYEKLTYNGAAKDYSNYLSNVNSSVVGDIAKGIKMPSYHFVASQNAQDWRGRPNGNFTIIGSH